MGRSKIQESADKYVKAIQRGQRTRFVSAVAWLNVIQYVEKCFAELQNHDIYRINRYYLTIDRTFPVTTLPNHIQIHAGHRKLGMDKQVDSNGEKTMVMAEGNAAIVFSQHYNGDVMILLYPYKSECYETNEKYLIYKTFDTATDISLKDVEKAFAAFLRYSKSTSCITQSTWSDYFFRLRFRLKDWTYRKTLWNRAKELIQLVKP
ncbi:hypothetical protein [Rheinheimera sp.]|uniref:hypothetical protein n=1 Tax=Rheinheimera sp. TaxID=1869214 RepID=UPI00307D77D0